jgi:Thermolysin metallopeptidase, alpha-helical domain
VHLNSGIPNRAFHLAATAIGGMAWQGAGLIWWSALTGGEVRASTDFHGFATATVAVAGEHRGAVEEAWAAVGVVSGLTAAPSPAPSPTLGSVPSSPAGELVVRRSGGFVGQSVEGRCDLSRDDPRSREARDLLDRVGPATVSGGDAMPDMYVYTFEVSGQAPVRVSQQHLTPELERLVEIVLEG